MTDTRSIQEIMAAELRRVAPGTPMREGLDMLISARSGALIVVGDQAAVEEISNGGFIIDTPFSAQRLFELCKMDGAILLDASCERILRANVHLDPGAGLPTSETGMRHRTAERVSRHTDALVIAISHRRNVVNMYLRGRRVTLADIDVLLAKANQAVQTLQNYRNRLDQMLEHLTVLEFEDLVSLDDVAEVVGRFEMMRRVAKEVQHYILELGTEGRLVRMQAEELTSNVSDNFGMVLRDYADDSSSPRILAIRERLAELPPDRLLEIDSIAHEMGLTNAEQGETHLRPRGHRALNQIPMLPGSVIARVVRQFGSLLDINRASASDLCEVEGVNERRAQAIIDGLARVRAHVSV